MLAFRILVAVAMLAALAALAAPIGAQAAKPGKSAKPGNSAKPGKSGKPGKSAKPGKPGKSGKQGDRRAAHKVKSAPTPAPVRAAAAVARRYWGTTPCGGQVKFVTRRAVAAGIDPTTSAWVTFATPLGANNLAAPAATYRGCVVSLTKWRWPTTASMEQDWDILCTTVVHEMGHLMGLSHENWRGSIMAPVFAEGANVPARCVQARPRAARR